MSTISLEQWKAAGLSYKQYENDRERGKLEATRGARNKPVQIYFDGIEDETKKAKIIAKFGDPNAKPEFTDPLLPNEHRSSKDFELAHARRNLVVAYRRAADEATGSKVEAKKEWVNLVSLGLICQKEYKIINEKLSFKTLERWNKQMRDGSNTMDDLLPKLREIKVGNELQKEHKDTLISLYCGQNQLKFSECIRLAQRQWRILGLPEVNDLRCRKFLTDWANQNAATAIFLRKGIKSLRDEILPYIDRDEDSIKFLDVLVADGHVLNFQIVNPETGKMCRPTLIAWVDMATRMPLGFEIMYTENTRSVLSAFRNACINAARLCGIEGGILPRSVYMDNGKSFKNKFFTAETDLENELGGLFERLRPFGLEHIAFARPYNARAKVIERVFRDFGEIERQLPTYCGTDIENKPASMKRNELWHREQLRRYLDAYGKVTLQSSYIVVKEWIDQFNERESDGKYLKGMTPLEAVQNQMPELDIMPRRLSLNQFDWMLMHTKVSRLHRNGFNVGGLWYYSVEFTQIAKDDTEYIIKYDVLNPDRILVYHEDETYWCSAGLWIGQKTHAMAALGSDADREKVKDANRALKGLEKEVLRVSKNDLVNGLLSIPEHATEPVPVLVEKTETDDYITTQDGRKIKLKYF
jgi:putative transposase